MLDRVWVIGVALAFSANAYAGGIYKCVSAEGTAYQSAPCVTGSEEVLAVTTTESLARPRADIDDATQGPSGRIADTAGGLSTDPRALGPNRLILGITDDQALNTPGWGPPKKILRHRERSGWREVWTYAPKAGGAPQLEFFNGRLVAISLQSESAESARFVTVSTE